MLESRSNGEDDLEVSDVPYTVRRDTYPVIELSDSEDEAPPPPKRVRKAMPSTGGARRAGRPDNGAFEKMIIRDNDIVPKYTEYPPTTGTLAQEDRDWELLMQRFIVLAVLRWHSASPEHIRKTVTVPYFQEPYERIKDRVKACTDGIFFRTNGQQIRPTLEAHPFFHHDSTAFTTRCLLCLQMRDDRLDFYEYAVWGHRYDEDTFVSDTTSSARRCSWPLGTTCFKSVTKGHAMHHRIYNTFIQFEKDQVKTIATTSPAWSMLFEGEIDLLVDHFKTVQVIDGPLPRATDVYHRTIEEIRSRMAAEIARCQAEAVRKATGILHPKPCHGQKGVKRPLPPAAESSDSGDHDDE